MDKAAIKKAYKESKRAMGIFGVTNDKNGKIYLGYGVDLTAIINRHKAELKFGTHRNKELQEAWKSFGESVHHFEILDELDQSEDRQNNPSEELPLLLEMWVTKLKAEGRTVALI